ncbi:hypothetical protein GCM10027022_17360 [Alpinimonas psychrophila]|uniref:DUF1643 domain-containing protein n=1 Tax=Alpinimonas psychrophila TaxID=748908 RepID=A0A7W3JUG4_9MICO|nr:DUF1643 domain-containing protein [Alpinimonas psychrophila]MBA8829405.1 hypothetical protein [Alpinimonas psychrophila]
MEWLYERTEDNSARFALGAVGERPLVCIGLNPSTATPTRLDATLTRVQAVAAFHGYDSFLMLNVYPLRSTDPAGLPVELDSELVEANARQIRKVLNDCDPDVWAAWGALITKRLSLVPTLIELLELPELTNARWFSHGPISKDGHPHHPLYVKDADPLMPFDIEPYRDKLRRLLPVERPHTVFHTRRTSPPAS